jgi:formylglycine-generating enzyme required for sulfatase activity
MGAAMNGHGSCEMAMPSNDAEPIRRVRVNGFWMDKTVVTNDPAEPNEPKHAHRGGSFLCNDQYCSRYIVGTRRKSEVNTGPNHLSFRCVKSARQDPQPIAIKSKN